MKAKSRWKYTEARERSKRGFNKWLSRYKTGREGYEYFDVGKEYIDEYVWATIETGKQMLAVRYKDEELMVREIKKFKYEINEVVHDREDSIFGTGL